MVKLFSRNLETRLSGQCRLSDQMKLDDVSRDEILNPETRRSMENLIVFLSLINDYIFSAAHCKYEI